MTQSTQMRRAAKNASTSASMNEPRAFTNVLVGVDGTSAGRDAIALGGRLRDPLGQLMLSHVVLARSPVYQNFHSSPRWRRQVRPMLERERETMGVTADLTGMFARTVGSGLHQLTEDANSDLLVVGSCHRGTFGRLLRGDDTRGSLNGAVCPVAVAPRGYAERSAEIRTIGVGYNGTPESEVALAAARVLAARCGATVRVLTAVWPVGYGARTVRTILALEEAAGDRLRSLAGVERRITFGSPDEELLAFGDQVDLLVIGSRGHGPLCRLVLGSTSAHLARSAEFPVLVLPPLAGRARRPIARDARRATSDLSLGESAGVTPPGRPPTALRQPAAITTSRARERPDQRIVADNPMSPHADFRATPGPDFDGRLLGDDRSDVKMASIRRSHTAGPTDGPSR